jgi:hypothetical protein
MAFDTWTQRRGMMGYGYGMLPEATGSFDGIDAQLFLALPGQYEIENGTIPETPDPETGAGGRTGPRRKTGIGPR